VVSGDRDQVQSMLLRVHEQGSAPAILVRLGEPGSQWMIRASLMAAEPDRTFLLQLTPAGSPAAGSDAPEYSVEELIGRGPDGFVVIDAEGAIVRANRAFLNLVQVSAEGAIAGESLSRWLGRPGADLTVLLATLQRHGVVRLFTTTIHGGLGTDTEVELSAVGDGADPPRFFGVIVRHVGRRLSGAKNDSRLTSALGSLADQIGNTTLRSLVKDTVSAVEQHYLEAALEITQGNRSAAASLLGLSRQSLYEKLNRYGLDNDSKSTQSGA
jgi:transcriptional regulator PpsR